MKVAFIIHRYGADLGGGIERHCQLVAEHMSKHWHIEVLTTCARDFMTWKNEYPPGRDHVNGIPIQRFPVDHERDPASFRQLTDQIYGQPVSGSAGQLETWMRAQGPYSTDLLNFLTNHRTDYDAFIFFSYLYATTYFGLPLVADKAMLVPAAHDEPTIRLPIFRSVFTQPKFIFFNTLEERRLIRSVCATNPPGEITGVAPGPVTIEQNGTPPAPYLIYIGRIDEQKGCGELIGYFLNSHELTGLNLYLVGPQMIEVPPNPRIHTFGYLDEPKKNALLKNALALVMPSFYESLSLVLLESWSLAIPVLVNARCEALKGQISRSGGGLSYTDIRTFAQQATTLSASPALRCTLGLRGQRYVKAMYSWPRIEEKYLFALSALFVGPK